MATARLPPLPPDDLRFMGESDQRFLSIARQSASLLVAQGLGPGHSVLDVGCGYGRLPFGLLIELNFSGCYTGFDLLPRHVAWCNEQIGSRHPTFTFAFLDIANPRYNPEGTIDARALRFPFPLDTFDFCAVFSVFTHMYEPEIRNYMEQIRRVLKPSGRCVATFFLFDETRLPTIIDEGSPLPMTYELDAVTRYSDPTDPLHAIAYERAHIERAWSRSGFDVVDLLWGSWAGDSRSETSGPVALYQDVLIVEKSE